MIRTATVYDLNGIKSLYLRVAENEGGIARLESEITDDYISGFLRKSLTKGIILVAESDNQIVGEIHAYSPGIQVFDHVFSELTIVVDPDFQGTGIGKKLFTTLLKKVENEFPDIARVELIARESNTKAIRFYESIGFKIEGRFEMRIKSSNGKFEADIPMGWLNPKFERETSYTSLSEIEKLISGFESKTLPKEKWTHHAHLTAGIWYLLHKKEDDAISFIRNSIKTYNVSVGGQNTETSGYHETITLFYMNEISRFIKQNFIADKLELINSFFKSEIVKKEYPFQFYSKDLLASSTARLNWVEPDLRPLTKLTSAIA